MRRAEALRAHAESARRLADTAGTEDRKCLLALAREWLKAAEQLERKPPTDEERRSLSGEHRKEAAQASDSEANADF